MQTHAQALTMPPLAHTHTLNPGWRERDTHPLSPPSPLNERPAKGGNYLFMCVYAGNVQKSVTTHVPFFFCSCCVE